MQRDQVLFDLDAALDYATLRNNSDWDVLSQMLDDIREMSYGVLPLQKAFFIRSACSAVEHVAKAAEPQSAYRSAADAIARVRAFGDLGSHDLTAA
ncbi:hypothetical protein EDD53_0936 [Pacificibacter maritimus]|uniref:Uncharacterized protein n=1 Tax=Pacificibacter maritimus TaxID=762213 RepID=A0A3N4V3X5_9RHOB|nr:hypothetical protein [Pacificibacter maritimus]RPE71807.1 hypothetical protein EDD53_0936 [Pacificibacter maritimus]